MQSTEIFGLLPLHGENATIGTILLDELESLFLDPILSIKEAISPKPTKTAVEEKKNSKKTLLLMENLANNDQGMKNIDARDDDHNHQYLVRDIVTSDTFDKSFGSKDSHRNQVNGVSYDEYYNTHRYNDSKSFNDEISHQLSALSYDEYVGFVFQDDNKEIQDSFKPVNNTDIIENLEVEYAEENEIFKSINDDVENLNNEECDEDLEIEKEYKICFVDEKESSKTSVDDDYDDDEQQQQQVSEADEAKVIDYKIWENNKKLQDEEVNNNSGRETGSINNNEVNSSENHEVLSRIQFNDGDSLGRRKVDENVKAFYSDIKKQFGDNEAIQESAKQRKSNMNGDIGVELKSEEEVEANIEEFKGLIESPTDEWTERDIEDDEVLSFMEVLDAEIGFNLTESREVVIQYKGVVIEDIDKGLNNENNLDDFEDEESDDNEEISFLGILNAEINVGKAENGNLDMEESYTAKDHKSSNNENHLKDFDEEIEDDEMLFVESMNANIDIGKAEEIGDYEIQKGSIREQRELKMGETEVQDIDCDETFRKKDEVVQIRNKDAEMKHIEVQLEDSGIEGSKSSVRKDTLQPLIDAGKAKTEDDKVYRTIRQQTQIGNVKIKETKVEYNKEAKVEDDIFLSKMHLSSIPDKKKKDDNKSKHFCLDLATTEDLLQELKVRKMASLHAATNEELRNELEARSLATEIANNEQQHLDVAKVNINETKSEKVGVKNAKEDGTNEKGEINFKTREVKSTKIAGDINVKKIEIQHDKIKNVEIDLGNMAELDEIQDTRTEDVEAEEIKAKKIELVDSIFEDTEVEGYAGEEIKVEDSTAEEIKLEGSNAENAKVRGFETVDTKARDAKAKGAMTEDINAGSVEVEKGRIDDCENQENNNQEYAERHTDDIYIKSNNNVVEEMKVEDENFEKNEVSEDADWHQVSDVQKKYTTEINKLGMLRQQIWSDVIYHQFSDAEDSWSVGLVKKKKYVKEEVKNGMDVNDRDGFSAEINEQKDEKSVEIKKTKTQLEFENSVKDLMDNAGIKKNNPNISLEEIHDKIGKYVHCGLEDKNGRDNISVRDKRDMIEWVEVLPDYEENLDRTNTIGNYMGKLVRAKLHNDVKDCLGKLHPVSSIQDIYFNFEKEEEKTIDFFDKEGISQYLEEIMGME